MMRYRWTPGLRAHCRAHSSKHIQTVSQGKRGVGFLQGFAGAGFLALQTVKCIGFGSQGLKFRF